MPALAYPSLENLSEIRRWPGGMLRNDYKWHCSQRDSTRRCKSGLPAFSTPLFAWGIQRTLEYRMRKIDGGGAEWFTTTLEEVI
jgi:hypothetical protein